jgi:uncharacterized protein (DUF302 family)
MNRLSKLWILTVLVIIVLWAVPTYANHHSVAETGVVRLKSAYSVEETADRLEAILQQREINLFERIDHAAGARSVGQELRPTQLMIFGNPNVGTPLMQCNQSVAIDLPQKALIWLDETNQTWLGYNDPAYLMTRHNLAGCEAVIERLGQVLNAIATEAVQE